MPALSAADQLRNLLGEPIPEGGTESDTLIPSKVITDLLVRHSGPMDACLEGWKIKAALLATLVDQTSGDSQQKLSQAHTAAMQQVKLLQSSDVDAPTGGTRMHKIVRGGFPG